MRGAVQSAYPGQLSTRLTWPRTGFKSRLGNAQNSLLFAYGKCRHNDNK
jgi:hypothetical protein